MGDIKPQPDTTSAPEQSRHSPSRRDEWNDEIRGRGLIFPLPEPKRRPDYADDNNGTPERW